MRRRSRECALQILYQMDANHQLGEDAEAGVDNAILAYWASFDGDIPVDREFAERLVRGVVQNLAGVDESIVSASDRWKLGRMAAVDRNLLRVASFEIRSCPDIPTKVSINESLEIAKRFSGTEAARFINGVLDNLAKGVDAGRQGGDA